MQSWPALPLNFWRDAGSGGKLADSSWSRALHVGISRTPKETARTRGASRYYVFRERWYYFYDCPLYSLQRPSVCYSAQGSPPNLILLAHPKTPTRSRERSRRIATEKDTNPRSASSPRRRVEASRRLAARGKSRRREWRTAREAGRARRKCPRKTRRRSCNSFSIWTDELLKGRLLRPPLPNPGAPGAPGKPGNGGGAAPPTPAAGPWRLSAETVPVISKPRGAHSQRDRRGSATASRTGNAGTGSKGRRDASSRGLAQPRARVRGRRRFN